MASTRDSKPLSHSSSLCSFAIRKVPLKMWILYIALTALLTGIMSGTYQDLFRFNETYPTKEQEWRIKCPSISEMVESGSWHPEGGVCDWRKL